MKKRDHSRSGSPSRRRRLSTTIATLLRKSYHMSEGRRSQIVLLDERRLDLVIQPKLYAGELLDLVASHFHLKEKEYFGIAYYPQDSNQFAWLQLEKRVLDHDLPKKSFNSNHGPPPVLNFYFRVKYYVESITHLGDSATVEAFYLQAKSLLAKGELEGDCESVFQLAALVLQATYGDYLNESVFRTQLRRLPILPAFTLKESPSISQCEDKVLHHYKNLAGQPRGSAIVNYLTIVESLPTYGQHYYEVKDKTNAPCWLGLSYKGIGQYDRSDRRNPKRVFLWKQLENLYYRDKKFTIEVHEARRVVHTLSSFNLYEDAIEEPVEDYDDLSDAICDPTTQVSVSRRTLAPANVTVYVWYASSPSVAKCIWSMAIAQHHFFLDRKHRKSQTSVVPSLSQIASELCKSVQSLSSIGSHSNISRSASTSSLPSTILGGELSEESKAATIEMLAALRARKEALDEALKKKTEELKTLCLKEGELTGEIPAELPLQPGESKPQVRRRVGTSFSLSDKVMCKVRNKERETLSDLELEYEIQSKIASAAFQLANDCTARKSVRKQRKISYIKATDKLRSIEQKIYALQRERKKAAEKNDLKLLEGVDEIDSPARKDELDSASLHGTQESSISSHSNSTIKSAKSSSSVPHLIVTPCEQQSPVPRGESYSRQRHQSLQNIPSLSPAERGVSVYDPCSWSISSSCSPNVEFDSVSCNSGTLQSQRVPYRNRFECRLDIDGSNLYSVPNRRASQIFDSQDDLLINGRNEYDRKSPAAKVPINRSECSGSGFPLSSSYDEHKWYGNVKHLECFPSHNTSFEMNNFEYDRGTINSNKYETYRPKRTPNSSQRNSPKLIHFRSENCLQNDELNFCGRHLENSHISEPDLIDTMQRKMMHVQSVPHLHKASPMSSGSEPHSKKDVNCISNSSHSIKQVADLVNASMLLQDSKRSASSFNIGYSPSKVKTKEWIETSLDSPLPIRKHKPQPLYENHPLPRDLQNNSYTNAYDAHNVHSPTSRSDPISVSQQLSFDGLSHDREYPSPYGVQNHMYSSSSANARPMDSCSRHRPSRDEEISNAFNPYAHREVDENYRHSNGLSEETLAYHQSSSNDSHRDISSAYEYNVAENSRPKSPLYVNVYHDPPANNVIHSSNAPHEDSRSCVNRRHPSHNAEISHASNGPLSHSLNHPVANHLQTTTQNVSSPHHAQNCPMPENTDKQLPYGEVPCVPTLNEPVVTEEQEKSKTYSPSYHYSTETVINVPQETIVPLPSCDGTNFPYPGSVEVNVVTVGHFQPYWEETKPYEISDFYKYSTKHRKSQPKSNCSDNSSHVESDHLPDNRFQEAMGQVPECQAAASNYSFRNVCEDLTSHYVSSPPNSEMIVNAYPAVVDNNSDVKNHNICNQELNSNPVSPSLPGDPNGSFGEMFVPNSLADSFQREMMAWYNSRETIKKATLV